MSVSHTPSLSLSCLLDLLLRAMGSFPSLSLLKGLANTHTRSYMYSARTTCMCILTRPGGCVSSLTHRQAHSSHPSARAGLYFCPLRCCSMSRSWVSAALHCTTAACQHPDPSQGWHRMRPAEAAQRLRGLASGELL